MDRSKIVIYVSGPYTSSVAEEIDQNIHEALMTARNIWNMGFVGLCPHANTYHFERYAPELTWEDYIKRDLELLRRCDGIFMMPKWEMSRGAIREKEYAEDLGLPVFFEYFDIEAYEW